MQKQQQAIKDAVCSEVNISKEKHIEADLNSVTEYYRGFKSQFKTFQDQIKLGNFTQVDAWCADLVSGKMPVTAVMINPVAGKTVNL